MTTTRYIVTMEVDVEGVTDERRVKHPERPPDGTGGVASAEKGLRPICRTRL